MSFEIIVGKNIEGESFRGYFKGKVRVERGTTYLPIGGGRWVGEDVSSISGDGVIENGKVVEQPMLTELWSPGNVKYIISPAAKNQQWWRDAAISHFLTAHNIYKNEMLEKIKHCQAFIENHGEISNVIQKLDDEPISGMPKQVADNKFYVKVRLDGGKWVG